MAITSRIQKASKKKSKLRVMLDGASGSGKTYSALVLAKEFGRTCVIDTETGSASLYADLFGFDVIELPPPFTPESYIEAIHEIEKTGEYDVLIIDSITHEWQSCLDIQSKLGGRFQDWNKVSPRHQNFVDTILNSSLHVICTCRSKMEYLIDEQTKKITKAGLAPVQRDGLSYEFTVVFDLNQSHMASASKDRTSLFDGKEAVITPETGKKLINWLNSGVEPKPITPAVSNVPVVSKFLYSIRTLKGEIDEKQFFETLAEAGCESEEDADKASRDTQTKIYKQLVALKGK